MSTQKLRAKTKAEQNLQQIKYSVKPKSCNEIIEDKLLKNEPLKSTGTQLAINEKGLAFVGELGLMYELTEALINFKSIKSFSHCKT